MKSLLAAGGIFSQEGWRKAVDSTTTFAGDYLPHVIAAVLILIIGWLVALIVAAAVRGALSRTGLSRRLGRWFVSDPGQEVPRVERPIAKGVFWILMLFVLVAFFQTLKLTAVTEPLTNFLNKVFSYAPQAVAAGLLLIAAWIVATAVRFLVRRGLTATKLDRRLSRQAGVEDEESVPMTRTVADAAYWLVFLLFLPAVLNALSLPGLLTPVQEMLTKILNFLPNLFAAAVVLVVGWFLARIVQRIVANLLVAVGVDRLGERIGMQTVLEKGRLSDVVALVVYVLILIPVLIAALNALAIDAVTQPASEMLNKILGVLPGIFAAVLVVGISYVVGRVVAGLTTKVLAAVGFNKLPATLGLGSEPAPGQRTPADLAGSLLLIAIVLVAVMQALPMLGFNLAAELTAQFVVFAGHVFLGLVIITLGLYLGKLADETIRATGVVQARLFAPVARIAIIVLASAMGLRHMGLADEIVNLTFGLVLGAIAVAAAIAFGIGGREAAKAAIEEFVASKKSDKK
ncbi:MAG: mechanosensitive ion channel [Pirellulales bacterium]|nr:mechanosensitive ion channel [Pirellulales bacterium]